jgi:hypothetical protein
MIAAWMLYGIGIGLALVVAGYAAERALYLLGRPTRWAWTAALLGTLLLPVVAMLQPAAFGSITVPVAAPAPVAPAEAVPVPIQGAAGSARASSLTWTDLDNVLRWGGDCPQARSSSCSAWPPPDLPRSDAAGGLRACTGAPCSWPRTSGQRSPGSGRLGS